MPARYSSYAGHVHTKKEMDTCSCIYVYVSVLYKGNLVVIPERPVIGALRFKGGVYSEVWYPFGNINPDFFLLFYFYFFIFWPCTASGSYGNRLTAPTF